MFHGLSDVTLALLLSISSAHDHSLKCHSFRVLKEYLNLKVGFFHNWRYGLPETNKRHMV